VNGEGDFGAGNSFEGDIHLKAHGAQKVWQQLEMRCKYGAVGGNRTWIVGEMVPKTHKAHVKYSSGARVDHPSFLPRFPRLMNGFSFGDI
jgi:hypothetical protein